ncbi:pituitary tumor-transforming gene 1 protein-interacting protein [Triplophysa rosa]|uniref:Pituitary tumor-transforming gene 1 protein-interacting protein n=1 Tax=Triplophysa rosa TaxID=992332 RepID=A0A9W7WQK2_TRIRA|nr:pituitary tumor-transforming gene 1 protein-interacting protein [Triplophysa rosa]KAI7806465.1 Pituitary tumor-transforming gene 1 protein-interacting protein precursor [Triplophysa rosa]
MDKIQVLLSIFAVLMVRDQFSEAARTTTQTTTTSARAPTIRPPVRKPCNTLTSCDSCLANVSCLWCQTNNTCTDYPVSYIIPPSSVCKLSQARWGVCWVNFESLIIAMAVVSGVLLLAVTVCCCCCCCCRRSRSTRSDREEEQYARRREEITQRADERRAERRTKHDQIRKKYGLIPDSDHPYSKFENE